MREPPPFDWIPGADPMTLLDTNGFSELMRPESDQGVVAWLDEQDSAAVFLSVITEAELRYVSPYSRKVTGVTGSTPNLRTCCGKTCGGGFAL